MCGRHICATEDHRPRRGLTTESMGALIGGWPDVALAAVSMALVIGCSHQCQSINLVARYLETSNPLVPPLSVSQPILNVPYFISRYGQGRAGQAGTTNLHSTYLQAFD